MDKIRDVSGVILAGGLSTRIGRDKGGLTLGGAPLGQRVVETIGSIFEEVIYVTNDPMNAPAYSRIKLAKDEVPHLGPLGGILAGLRVSDASRAFIVGYDMPFATKAVIDFMVGYAPGADAVVVRRGDKLEPLHAVYSRACIAPISEQLGNGNNRIIALYDRIEVSFVDEAELRTIDPELLSFFNVNTMEDLETAERLLRPTAGTVKD